MGVRSHVGAHIDLSVNEKVADQDFCLPATSLARFSAAAILISSTLALISVVGFANRSNLGVFELFLVNEKADAHDLCFLARLAATATRISFTAILIGNLSQVGVMKGFLLSANVAHHDLCLLARFAMAARRTSSTAALMSSGGQAKRSN
jgi:hypothetical protein